MDILLPNFTTFSKHGRGNNKILQLFVTLLALRTISCQAVEAPVILEEGSEKTIQEGQTLMMSCHGEVPLKWSSHFDLKTNDRVNLTLTERKTNKFGDLRKYSSRLIFSNIMEKDSGVFFCQYEDPSLSSYNDNIYINVVKNSMPGKRAGFFTVPKIIAIMIVGLLVLVVSLLVLLRRYKNKLRDFREKIRQKPEAESEELDHLQIERHGESNNYYKRDALGNTALGIDLSDEPDLLPLHVSWEFPRDYLKLGPQLGSGAFGRVLKAEATGLSQVNPAIASTVAVKMVKPNADETHLRALLCELKIMANLGRHINVVNLIGYSTKGGAINNDLYVVVEFCTRGSLLNYIRRNNKSFVNQLCIKERNEIIDGNINEPAYLKNEQAQASSTATSGINNINYALAMGMGSSTGNDSSGRSSCSYPVPSAGGGTPSVQNFQFDYQHEGPQTFTTTDLLCWAFQIARGMEYLASRKVIHGDLAARNVLLTENNVVKICDFGLSKEIYKNYSYIMSTKGGKFPIKWMAIEAIIYGELSAESDSWSFGVVLWELFSLGKMPYTGLKADQELIRKIEEGFRMDKPEYAPTPVYDIMMECWSREGDRRPPFALLVDQIGSILEGELREHYVQLNTDYVRNSQYRIPRDTKIFALKPEVDATLPEADSSGYLPPIQLVNRSASALSSSSQVPGQTPNRVNADRKK